MKHVLVEWFGLGLKPPGGSIPTARWHISDEFCSFFGLNRLATMNSCQVARLCSRSLLMFVAISNTGVPPGGALHAARRRWVQPPGDSPSVGGSALRGAWRHGVLRQAVARKQWGLGACWRLAGGEYRQAVWSKFAWRRVGRARRERSGRFMAGVTCDDMSGEVHIKLLSRGDTSGEVRRAGLRAGRFVEAGPRAGSSPFLFVCGDDRVIRYTGADVDTGSAEDAQMAE
ncbi:hypothetical protein DEO72_LG1g1622 [Vigna unguiculata]|uniref:Uncharacterized protein n=1 Tax=Vigna unguiculata TaxID=3917 RepID=A0A4D6KNB4_VIGUN|nr:hypothetical protein DEO72_LG1g1622 [Vigna unguiculata]